MAALRVLVLNSEITALRAQLTPLEQTRDGFAAREEQLRQALGEITETSTDEERNAVSSAVDTFEQERSANAAEIARIQGEIDTRSAEIARLEAEQTPPPAAPAVSNSDTRNNDHHERSFVPMSNPTERRWFGLTYAERDALMQSEQVRTFLKQIREARAQQRSVTGGELGIPDGFLPILRDLTYQESKFLRYCFTTSFRGTTRQNVAGVAPEAIWTEMKDRLNEIDIDFWQLTMDGFMVGGYMAVPNSVLMDDSDLSLTTTILQALASSLAKAIDKSIWFGTGESMPVGIITRLAAQTKPTWWGSQQGDFTDLHTSNILKLDLAAKNGVEFFRPLVAALAVAKPDYSNGTVIWVMNRKTHMDIQSRALAFNDAAALVAGVSNSIPIVGGEIVEWEVMPDNEIAGGYMSLYRSVEREGTTIESNTNVRWLENQTCFKGMQRRDGKPAIGEAFVLVNYGNVQPTTTTTFGKDRANTAIGTLIVTTAAGAANGKSVVTVAGNGSGKLKYQTAGQAIAVANGETLDKLWTDLPANKTVDGTTGQTITVVEVDGNGRAVAVGSGSVTAKAG
nr:MAG TPA: major capsid protein [Caudoviricetes sp.]